MVLFQTVEVLMENKTLVLLPQCVCGLGVSCKSPGSTEVMNALLERRSPGLSWDQLMQSEE